VEETYDVKQGFCRCPFSVPAFLSLEPTWIGMWLPSETPGSTMRKPSEEFTAEQNTDRQSRHV
jgi:hypothetical protein